MRITFPSAIDISNLLGVEITDGEAGQVLTVPITGGLTAVWRDVEIDTWRLIRDNDSQISLIPLGQNGGSISINGRMLRFSSPVSVSATGLDPDTTYYVYAYDAGNMPALVLSTDPPNTFDQDAMALRTGDNNYRLVGYVTTDGSSLFPSNGVRSVRFDNPETRNLYFECRISGSSVNPEPVSVVGPVSSVYIHPFRGNRVSVYDASAGQFRVVILDSPIEVAVPATTDTNYDVFLTGPGGLPYYYLQAWGSDSSRAPHSLTSIGGVLVDGADPEATYVGSFRTGSVAGQTHDSSRMRFIWSHFNRISRGLFLQDTANFWDFVTTGDETQQANNEPGNQVELLVGVQGEMVNIRLDVCTSCSTTIMRGAGISAGASLVYPLTENVQWTNMDNNIVVPLHVELHDHPLGYQVYKWFERNLSAGTTRWYSDPGSISTEGFSGLMGQFMG